MNKIDIDLEISRSLLMKITEMSISPEHRQAMIDQYGVSQRLKQMSSLGAADIMEIARSSTRRGGSSVGTMFRNRSAEAFVAVPNLMLVAPLSVITLVPLQTICSGWRECRLMKDFASVWCQRIKKLRCITFCVNTPARFNAKGRFAKSPM